MVMALVLAAVVFPGFRLVESTSRADWYVLDGESGLHAGIWECEYFLEHTERDMGVHVPHFTYQIVKTRAEVSFHSKDKHDASGVADSDPLGVVTLHECSTHEITHLITFQFGRSDRMFEEGIASMLGRDNSKRERKANLRRMREAGITYEQAEEDFRRPIQFVTEYHEQYLLADSWVRYLVGRYGKNKFFQFLRNCPRRDSTHAAFAQTYGLDLDEEFARWLGGPSRK